MVFSAVLYRYSYVNFKDSSRTDQMTTIHVTVKGQIMYFLVNVSSPTPLKVATSNFECRGRVKGQIMDFLVNVSSP